jgi:hypothetical protein
MNDLDSQFPDGSSRQASRNTSFTHQFIEFVNFTTENDLRSQDSPHTEIFRRTCGSKSSALQTTGVRTRRGSAGLKLVQYASESNASQSHTADHTLANSNLPRDSEQFPGD